MRDVTQEEEKERQARTMALLHLEQVERLIREREYRKARNLFLTIDSSLLNADVWKRSQ